MIAIEVKARVFNLQFDQTIELERIIHFLKLFDICSVILPPP